MGGCRQRMRRAENALQQQGLTRADSKLLRVLLRGYLWGEFSAALCQRLAAAAVEDGVDVASLKALASSGCNGLYPGNVLRDMRPLMPKGPLANTLKTFQTPMNVKQGAGTVTKKVASFAASFSCFGAYALEHMF